MKDTKEYMENVLRTENVKEVYLNEFKARLLHGVMGVATEAGEMLDPLKKHIFYDVELDIVNIKEEMGDVFWYIGIICSTLEVDFLEIMDLNIKKLQKRYPKDFNREDATIRNIDKELSHYNQVEEKFRASKCPKCDIDPQMTISSDVTTSRFRSFVHCPECQLTSPDGKDYVKGKAMNKGVEEWEKMLKERSSLPESESQSTDQEVEKSL